MPDKAGYVADGKGSFFCQRKQFTEVTLKRGILKTPRKKIDVFRKECTIKKCLVSGLEASLKRLKTLT